MICLKVVVPLGIAVGLLFQGTAFASFPDVASSHQNYDAILYLQSAEYVSGYPDGTYQPGNLINRAEFVKILAGVHRQWIQEEQKTHPNGPFWEDGTCIAAFSDPEIGLPFKDVRKTDWFAHDVCFASSQLLISGYPDGTFRPAININFAEAAKIIANVIFSPEEMSFEVTHPEPWYAEAVFQLTSQNAVPLSIRSVDQLITRGEMAEMIYRLKDGNFEKPSRTYDELVAGGSTSGTMNVKLYFGDKKIMEESNCAATRSVTRQIPKTSAIADATLRLLLQGVTPADGEQGLVSGFDNISGYYGKDVGSLLSYYHGISVVNGVATVKFSGGAMAYLNNTACTQEEVKGSIGATLLQFPTIKSVQYSVDGKVVTEWDA
ncbi:hypothetical protein EXS70_01720 [Candidatus Peribacteria bacterium]|nr:hypothetical protein [Candidatus Peribacteria bacterium]